MLTAESIGLRALAFIAGQPEAFGRFITGSGADATSLRTHASEPQTLVAVLDFLLANEELLIEFCGEQHIDFKTVHVAAARLGS